MRGEKGHPREGLAVSVAPSSWAGGGVAVSEPVRGEKGLPSELACPGAKCGLCCTCHSILMVPGATLISDKPTKAQRYYATQPIRGCIGMGRGTMFQAAPIWPDIHILFLEFGSVDIWGYILCFVCLLFKSHFFGGAGSYMW